MEKRATSGADATRPLVVDNVKPRGIARMGSARPVGQIRRPHPVHNPAPGRIPGRMRQQVPHLHWSAAFHLDANARDRIVETEPPFFHELKQA